MFEIYKDHSQKCSEEYVNIRKYELYKQQIETQQRLKQHQHHNQHQQSLSSSSSVPIPSPSPTLVYNTQQQQQHYQSTFSNNSIVDLNKNKLPRTKSSSSTITFPC